MRRSAWILALGILCITTAGACLVELPLGYDHGVTATEVSCVACLDDFCGDKIYDCGKSNDCGLIPACVTGCAADAAGSKQCLRECATGFADGDSRRAYEESVAACTQVHCRSECSLEIDLDRNGQIDGREQECGVAGTFGDLVDLAGQHPFEGGCGECLRSACCEIGLRCGEQQACWDRYACELGCISASSDCPCGAEPAPHDYAEFASCMSANCQGPVGPCGGS